MHELSIVYELYRTVTQLAAEAGLHRVEAVRLQVGELSGVEGPYLRECWNAVVRDTPLRSTRLELEHLPAIAMCAHCARLYAHLACARTCPRCGSHDHLILSGRPGFLKDSKLGIKLLP